MLQRNNRNASVALMASAMLLSALLLSGCSDRDRFPSLARRPAEDAYRNASAKPVSPPPPAVLSQGIAERIADLRGKATEAHNSFEAARPAAERAVTTARGAAKGTEGWSVASVALARLESARARVGLPLADLDRMENEAGNRAVDGSDADLKAVLSARREVEALVAQETEVINGLLARLAG